MKKLISVMLVLGVFGAMALGSGEKNKSTVDSAKATAAKDAEVNQTEKEELTVASETENEIQYEVTDTKFNYYTNSIGNVEYFGIVEIKNTGSSYLYLDNCTFDLEDNNGHLLQSEDFISKCPDVIAPGEKGYFYNGIGSMLIDDGVSFDNGVNFVPQFSIEVAKKGADAIVEYEVTDTELKEGTYGPKVTGRVTNSTSEKCSYLYIGIIFYGENGEVLAITGTSITDFDAGLTKSFDCDCIVINDEIVDSIKDFKVIARDSYMQF